MFTISVKITKRQILAAGAAFVLAFAGGVWAKAALSELRGEAVESSASVHVEKMQGKTQEQRIAFLESFGWEVEAEESEIVEVVVPKEFDDVMKQYNELQKKQGCNLEKYAGKRCKRYTYVITNYPGQTEHIRANILIYNGKIIGGDICSLELEGFMHGFVREDGQAEKKA